MSFSGLSADIRELMKDTVPTEIQERAIPEILSGKNVLLISPTGSGKTEAAMLPVFHMLSEMGDEGRTGIRVLYVTPLRALNRDMMRRMTNAREKIGFTVGVRHSDTTQAERHTQSASPPQVLITTPETLQILFLGKKLKKALENVRWVIIDEIHELADSERGAQLSVALERLSRITKHPIQRIGLSATVGTPDEITRFLAGSSGKCEVVKPKMYKCMQIEVQTSLTNDEKNEFEKSGSAANRPANRQTISKCMEYIEKHRSTLIFVNTRDTAEWLAASMKMMDPQFPIGIHHGSLSRDVRMQMEDDFKSGKLKALICTSSLELGIDVGSADFVIQYNSPRQVTRIVQRVGRAGHSMDRISEGVILSTNPDELLESAVILDNVRHRTYEKSEIRKNALSVVANQIVAMALSDRNLSVKDAYEIISAAYPFAELTPNEFESVLRLLSDIREIHVENGIIRKGTFAMDYFYDNISMIPDEKSYAVRDIATRKIIGTLDENFITMYSGTESTFIFRGSSWRVVELRDEEILVEGVNELGVLPSWAGEELPVPFEIAMGVGKLRRTRNFAALPISKEAASLCNAYLEKQGSHPLADDRCIVIDAAENGRMFIINACFGTRVNETLGRYIAAMMSARFGESVSVETDAYRIIIETPIKTEASAIAELLKTTNPDAIESLMRIILRNTAVLRYQFINSAKKFGAIRKDADYRAISISKLLDFFENTPIYTEALNKTLWEKMDTSNTRTVLMAIQKNDITIHTTNRLTPVGTAGFDAKRELLVFGKPDKAILNALRERLYRTEMLLVCMSCTSNLRMRVADVNERIKCWNCGSLLIAAVHPSERESLYVLKKKNLTDAERKILKKIQKSANLVLSSGRRAVLILAGRGIGPDTAARLLEKPMQSEDVCLRAILEAEVTYAKTRRFWY